LRELAFSQYRRTAEHLISFVAASTKPAMDMTPHFPIYLDYGATTPVDPRVVDAMIPWLREHFGNPA
jgi:selenocysteine lyase/cysteine desulfurase